MPRREPQRAPKVYRFQLSDQVQPVKDSLGDTPEPLTLRAVLAALCAAMVRRGKR